MKDSPPRFFYGWVIVGVMAASGAGSMAMGTLNFGLFIKPMGDALGISRSWEVRREMMRMRLEWMRPGCTQYLFG